MKKQAIWLVLLAVVVAGAVWAATRMKPAEAVQRVDPKIVDANTGFGFRMLKQLASAGGNKTNVVISPTSLSLALSMTYNGASGTTKAAMAKALGYTGIELKQVNAGNKALLANLSAPGEGIEISVANSLWARKGVEFKPDFLANNRKYYQAEIDTLSTADKINAWVNSKTRGKIDKIVGRVDPSAILFLVNAVYFNGLWSSPFDAKLTKDGNFTLLGGKTATVPMMHQTERFEYLQESGFQLISLTYGPGRISMYVLLPANGAKLASLYKTLTPATWASWMKRIRDNSSEVELTLPKFKLEYKAEAEAKAALIALGMGVAFDPGQADFSAMCRVSPSRNVYIGEVAHKTYIDVYEKGTEAAAATSVGMVATAMPPPRIIPKMVVDHPFFFAIRDNMTGEMLFMGSVVDPR
jgi:serine protease inhibitor